MSRAVPEWIGRTDETAAPPRVQLRIVERQEGCCADCGAAFGAFLKPEFDHIRALINGGANREGNLQALCEFCHAPKTADDDALKAKVARVRAKHLGIAYKKRLVPASKGSGFRKKLDGTVIFVPEERNW